MRNISEEQIINKITAHFDSHNLLHVTNNANVTATVTVEYTTPDGMAARTTVSVDARKTIFTGVTGGPNSIVLSIAIPWAK